MVDITRAIFIGNSVGVITGLFALFHILVMIGIIPNTIVWGGRITDHGQLLKMESVSLFSLLLVGTLSVIYSRMVAADNGMLILRICMWLFAALFLLNTVGNVFAKTHFERFAFTPVTALLTYLMVRLALL